MAKARKKKPPVSFTPAPAVEAMAEQLIDQYHEHLITHNVRMEFIFRSDTPKNKGRSVSAVTRKVTSLAAFFGREDREATDAPTRAFFCIVVSRPSWDGMSLEKRLALLDHELCHCGASYDGDGNTKLEILSHDVEEFGAIVARHGVYKPDLERFAKAVIDRCPQQAEMAFEMPPLKNRIEETLHVQR